MVSIIPAIIKKLGLKSKEEFKIICKGKEISGRIFFFDEKDNELYQRGEKDSISCPAPSAIFMQLCQGKLIIKPMPWKPKERECYYTFGAAPYDARWIVKQYKWENTPLDNALLLAGWVYKTRQTAENMLKIAANRHNANYEE